MDNNSTERGAKPRNNRHKQQQNNRAHHRVVRKVPPRVYNDNRNIYITSKSDIKAQQKRCEDILNSGVNEIYLHCMGFSITRGLNLALRLIKNSEGALSYAINTSTLRLVDELHPLCDEDDITFRHRNNSALHIKIYNSNLFNIIVPKLPAQPALPKPDHSEDRRQTYSARQQTPRKPQQQKQFKTKKTKPTDK